MIAWAALAFAVAAFVAGIVAALSVPTPLREHAALEAFVLGSTWAFLASTAFAFVAWTAGL